jgi:hypothetical protein
MTVDESPVGEALRKRRTLTVALKAYLYTMFLVNALPFASAQPVGSLDSFSSWFGGSRYAVWASARLDMMRSVGQLLALAFRKLISQVAVFTKVWTWYVNLTDDDRVWVEIISVIVLYFVVRYLRAPALRLTEKKVISKDRFLGQFMTEKGLYYKVSIGGKEYLLPSSGHAEKPGHVDEMAMPGSEFFPCKAQPIGAILVATEGSDLSLFGTFWRCDDLFVTARHCSNTLSNSTARSYAAPLRQTRKGNWEIDDTKLVPLEENFFDPDQNLVTAYDVDVFVRDCPQSFWAKARVTKASTRVHSAYNLQVHSVGFTESGLLVSASGRTLEESGHELLHHTASTKKGFSGSIILCGSSVIGMHVSAADDHNVAIRVEWIKYLVERSCNDEARRKVYTYADASYKQHYRDNKWRGGVAKVQMMRDGNYAVVLRDGQATYGWDLPELVESFGYGNPEKDYDMFEDMLWADKKTHGVQFVSFDDENAGIKPALPKRKKSRSSSKKKVPKPKGYTVEEGFKQVHGPRAPPRSQRWSKCWPRVKSKLFLLDLRVVSLSIRK